MAIGAVYFLPFWKLPNSAHRVLGHGRRGSRCRSVVPKDIYKCQQQVTSPAFAVMENILLAHPYLSLICTVVPAIVLVKSFQSSKA